MENRVTNKQELQYIMDFYHLDKVPLRDGNKDLGYITNDMKYKGGSWKYTYEDTAFKQAFHCVNCDMEKFKSISDIAKMAFRTKLMYKSKESYYAVKSYCYDSDIRDSGVKVFKDELENCLVFVGNINQLRKFLSYAKNHWRYCNGTTYEYSNEDLVEWMDFFSRYGLYETYDSFAEYYHNSIVD